MIGVYQWQQSSNYGTFGQRLYVANRGFCPLPSFMSISVCKKRTLHANTNQWRQHSSLSFSNNQPLRLHGLLTLWFDFPLDEKSNFGIDVPASTGWQQHQHTTTHNNELELHIHSPSVTGLGNSTPPHQTIISTLKSSTHNNTIVAKNRSIRKLGNGHHSPQHAASSGKIISNI